MNSLSIQLRALCILFCVAGGVAALSFMIPSRTEFRAYAEDIYARCVGESYVPACYDREVPRLMDEGLSMEEAFEVARALQSIDVEYRYCHVLGHNLSAKETAKDPSRWKDVVARSPSGVCSNGAIHGAFQERFRSESLPEGNYDTFKEELRGACDARGSWSPTGLEQGSCIHALGHLSMYVTAADIRASLSLCDEIAYPRNGYDMRQLCYDGAFMQIFQPLEPDDFALIEGKEQTKTTVLTFCASFEAPYRVSCVSESAAFFREEMRKDPDALLGHCALLPEGQERSRCKNALVHYIVPQLNLDVDRVVSYCQEFPEKERSICFANAAARFIEVDWNNSSEALSVCERAGSAAESCYEELVHMASYNFHMGSKEFEALCVGLPSPWRERCNALRK